MLVSSYNNHTGVSTERVPHRDSHRRDGKQRMQITHSASDAAIFTGLLRNCYGRTPTPYGHQRRRGQILPLPYLTACLGDLAYCCTPCCPLPSKPVKSPRPEPCRVGESVSHQPPARPSFRQQHMRSANVTAWAASLVSPEVPLREICDGDDSICHS